MVGIAPPSSKARPRLLSRVIEEPAHLLGVQTQRAAGGCGCTESSHQNVSVFEDGPCANGLISAHPDVVAERHGSREVLPADADFFPDGERGRHDRAAGMRSSSS